jgi:TRAP-type C4-dicarboxylate transport system permease small subunit
MNFEGLAAPAALNALIQVGITLLLSFAIIVCLFFIIWGGVRWVTSGGDKTKVMEARSHIIAAVVGLVITFLVFLIFSVILSIFRLSLANISLPVLPD